MPRPRIHDFWIDRIRVLVANEPALSGAQIRKRLLAGNFKDAPTTVPSDRVKMARPYAQNQIAPRQERSPRS